MKEVIDKKKLKCVTKLKPNKRELAEIQFAFNVCKHVKSNAIVLCSSFSTIGIGAVMSAGFLIFASGKEGERYIGKNAGSMNHQHSDEMNSKMHDMRAQMKENQNCEIRCLNILKEATGMSMQEVRTKFIKNPSDQYYTAKQMIDMGIADEIL